MKSIYRFSLIPRRRLVLILLGLLVNAIILSSSFTFFTSFNDFTSNFLGGDSGTTVIYNPKANTIFTGTVPVYLSSQILEINGIENTSPEILTGAITLDEKIVSVRGVNNSFFKMGIISKTIGRVDKLEGKECLIGYRAFQRIDLELGNPITLRSTLKSTINEFTPVGVFTSDSPMDDEILVSLDYARIMNGLPNTKVTLIRVKLDENIINAETLGQYIGNIYSVNVNLLSETSFSSTLQVLHEDGKVIESKNINVPGEINFTLTYGKYIFSVENQEKEILIDQDRVIDFHLTQNMNKVEIDIINHLSGPIIDSKLRIENIETKIVEEFTSEDGRFDVFLETGTYNITGYSNGHKKTHQTLINKDSKIKLYVGQIPLHIQIYDSKLQNPIKDAIINIKGQKDNYTLSSDSQGAANYQLQEGFYNITVTKDTLLETKKIKLTQEKTIIFILGEKTTTQNLDIFVAWSNQTSIKDVFVTVKGNKITWTGYTNNQGHLQISELPSGPYSVTVEKNGNTITTQKDLTSDQTIEVIIPATINFDSNISPNWIKYLPQTITVTLSDVMFKNSMRILVNLISSTFFILASLFTCSTIINSADIIQNSIAENSRTIGVLRSIGATQGNSIKIFGQGLITASAFVGFLGYFIGFIAIQVASKNRLFVLAGYVLQPKLNYMVLTASTLICPLITAIALYLKLGDMLNLDIMTLLKKLRKQDILHFPKDIKYPVTAFIIPLIIRAIPELIVYPFSIGYDTVSAYIPALVALQQGFENQVYDFIYQRPFFWILASLPYPFDSASPFKFFPVLLHGLLGLSIFIYAKEITKENTKSLAISLLSTIYFISLRISWDLFGNELGLVLVFISLTMVTRELKDWGSVLLALTAFTATVLTHEAASMLLFAASIPIIHESYKKQGMKGVFLLGLIITPTLLFFLYRLTTLDFPMLYNPMNNVRYPSETYTKLIQTVSTLYVYVILPIIPVSILGLRTKKRSTPMLFWFLGASIAALSPILSPKAAITFWPRWAYMTVYPLAFYAVDGIYMLKRVKIELNIGKTRITNLRTVFSSFFIIIMILMSGTFLIAPTNNYQPYHTIYGAEAAWIIKHVPSSMLLSTVPPTYAQEAKISLEWINENTTETIALMVDEELRGYAALYSDHDRILIRDLGVPWYSNPYYQEDTIKAAEKYSDQGYEVYLIARHFEFSGFTVMLNGSYLNIYKFH